MNDERSTDLLSALPRTRPHRRSDKRVARPAASETRPAAESAARRAAARRAPARKPPARKAAARKAAARKAAAKPLRQPAQPRGIPNAQRAARRKPAPAQAPEIVGTAVQAVGELAEIGLTLAARALRNAVTRLPRP